MHAEVFTVATVGQVRDGLLSMVGGGWEYCQVDMFPAQVDLALVGVIAYAPEDYGRKHLISVAVQGDDGRMGDFGTIRVAPSTANAMNSSASESSFPL